MSGDDWRLGSEEPDERSFLRKFWIHITVGAVVLGGVVAFAVAMTSANKTAPRRAPELTMVNLVPPPPPVSTPPPPPPVEQQKVEKEEEMIPEEAPVDEPPEAPNEPPIGTDIKGDGKNDGFGLKGPGGTRLGNTGGTGSKYGAYASRVQAKIADALRSNNRTRSASLSVQVRVWPDSSGRITRAQLAGSSGDPSVDSAIQNEILNGLQLPGPPPEGMPLPIQLRLTARRP